MRNLYDPSLVLSGKLDALNQSSGDGYDEDEQ
jgi:hypothetical protein